MARKRVDGTSCVTCSPRRRRASGRRNLANFTAGQHIAIGLGVVIAEPSSCITLKTAIADPGIFGQYIFEKQWLSIEIVSLLLLVALIGALILGKRSKKNPAAKASEGEL